MTQIEKGEHFVVVRGFEMGKPLPVFAAMYGETDKDDKPRYDRSFDGCLFLALEVCEDVIAARCVAASDTWKQQYVGTVRSLNTRELEVWPVTEAYATAMLEEAPRD